MNKPNDLTKFTFLIFSVLLIPLCQNAQSNEQLSLDDLIAEAKINNPHIQESYNKWKSAEYKTKSVKSLDDPMASYGFFEDEVQTRVGPQEQKYAISQKIPFPGKLSLKGKAQSKHAQMLNKQYEAVENEIIKEVKFTFYDLFWVDRSLSINEEEKAILEKIEKVAQRKYESNLNHQQDVIKVQVELSKIIKKLFLLNSNRKSLNVKLNSLLNRDQNSTIPEIVDIEDQKFDYPLEDILSRAKESRQELLEANLSLERALYERSLAKMSYLPDFTLGAEYTEIGNGTTSAIDDGQDAWMGKVTVNVPIWFGKLRAQVKEKEAQVQAATHKREDIENRVAFEAQDMYFKISAYKDIVLLYQTALLPQAQQAFDSSQSGFEKDSVSFLDWLDTERTYLQTRLAYYKAITDFHKSIAYLERIIGEDLGGNNE